MNYLNKPWRHDPFGIKKISRTVVYCKLNNTTQYKARGMIYDMYLDQFDQAIETQRQRVKGEKPASDTQGFTS